MLFLLVTSQLLGLSIGWGVMIRIPLPDPVEYLVSRKFPQSPLIPREGPSGIPRGRFKHEQELIAEIEAYRSELRAIPREEFQTLVEQEQGES